MDFKTLISDQKEHYIFLIFFILVFLKWDFANEFRFDIYIFLHKKSSVLCLKENLDVDNFDFFNDYWFGFIYIYITNV